MGLLFMAAIMSPMVSKINLKIRINYLIPIREKSGCRT